MPLRQAFRPRREKLFGDGRPKPIDRNAKARITHLARALMRRTEPGRHYGLRSYRPCCGASTTPRTADASHLTSA